METLAPISHFGGVTMGILGTILGAIGRALGLGDVMNMGSEDLIAMQYEELRAVARPLFSAANKRIDRIKDADLTFTPALDAVEDGGGRFYLSDFLGPEDLNALRAEVFRAREFILAKTSTLSAARKFDAHMKEMIAGDPAATINRELSSYIWEVYRKAQEENFAGIEAYGSNNVVAMIYESVGNMDEEDLLALIRDTIKAEYETAEESYEAALAEEAGFVI